MGAIGRAVGWLGCAVALVGCSASPPAPGVAPTGRSAVATASSRPRDAVAARARGTPAPTCSTHAPAAARAETARIQLQDGHTSAPVALELSANGRILASGGLDGVIRVWDTQSGMLLRKVASPMGTASLSADGGVLAYASGGVGSQPSVMVLDLSAESEPRAIGEYGAFALSPDGKTVAVGFTRLSLFDVATGKRRGELVPFPSPARPPPGVKISAAWNANALYQLAFDSTGARLAVASGVEIAVMDVATRKVLRHAPHPHFQGDGSVPTSLRFAGPDTLILGDLLGAHTISLRPDAAPARTVGVSGLQSVALVGRRLFGAGATGEVIAWDIDKGARVEVPGLAGVKAWRLGASEDGSTLAATWMGSGDIQLLDPTTLKPLRTLVGKTKSIGGLAVAPGGDELASLAGDGTMARWNLGSGELGSVIAGGAGQVLAAYDRAGKLLVQAGGFEVRAHDAASGRLVRKWQTKGLVSAVAFLGAKQDLLTVTSDGEVEIWELGGAAPATTSPRGELARPAGRAVAKVGAMLLGAAAVSSDGTKLAVVSGSQAKTVPDPKNPKTWKWAYAESSVTLIGLSDGAKRWSVQVTTGYAQKWIAFGPDGSVLLSSVKDPRAAPERATQFGGVRDARELAVLDGATGRAVRAALVPSAGPIGVRGDAVMVGGLSPVLLGWPALAVRARPAVADNDVQAIAVHPTRAQFVLGGDGGASSLVSATDGHVIAMLAATAGGEYVALTPDGAYRASLDGARSIGWAFRAPLEGFAFEQFAARFERPDLVAERLAGKTGAPPAALARPPSVRLDGAEAVGTTAATRVRGRVEAPTWVERVRVFVNGRTAADRLICAQHGDVDVEVPLQAGRNRVTVVAYDGEGFASNPRALDVVAPASTRRPDLWVVSVGVSRYPNLPAALQLEFADDDARSIADAFAKLAGAGRPFAAIHATTLVDDQATVDAITSAARSLEAMAAGDLAVVFLAGHGVRADDGRMFYLTSRASATREGARGSGVGWDLLQTALGKARGRVVLLLDACHAGHVSTELVAPNEALASALAADDRAGVLVLAAARGSELSYEVETAGAGVGGSRGLTLAWDGKPTRTGPALTGGHGLFTSALLEALRGEAPDRDRSGAVELGELVDYVTERVRAASNGKQTPWVARREMFGDFPLVEPRRAQP